MYSAYNYIHDLKVQFNPRRDHEGPEGECRYSSTLSLTAALDGVSAQRHAPAALPPRTNCTGVA